MNERWLWAFPAIGGFLLAVALVLQVHRWNEEEHMLRMVGSVVSVSGKGCPVVEFSPRSGERVTVAGTVCSRPGYEIGESVELLYDRTEPQNAHINSFAQNWFVSLMLGGFGLVFLLGGLLFIVPELVASRRRAGLHREGKRVQARFLEVRRNPLSTLNHVPAWQLVCQWQNPASGAVHLFYSEDLWFDPQPFIAEESLPVLIDPQNPRRYSVDISFLPRLAQ
ncbi:DUF3592 domain-containing protein [Aquipseudomonas campi]|uniref:DUF3592 domain-containing protein n=1 Tax=Aquipseudomonas campi TaxID=2731681 RepID=A0A6M8FZ80_9GAMM|nr:DUF3592 domain-containing protein [Pseudomonas campi]QKE65116.1 DUF3592 domain-containing protein [Pseudomonas campi]